MTARNEPAVKDSLDAITDALLTASRLLVAISAGSIARVDDLALQPRNRVLSGRARGKTRGCRPHGTPCMLALSAQGHRLTLQAEVIFDGPRSHPVERPFRSFYLIEGPPTW